MRDEPTRLLLQHVFPDGPGGSGPYLEWLYRDSPFGPVVEANHDDEDGRAGHYAVVPCPLWIDGAQRAGALSLNTAVHERARGGGIFTHLAERTFAQARKRGITDVVGVANANSTPGFVRRLGFTSLGSLPARVLLPRSPGRGAKSTMADADLVASAAFRARLAQHLDTPPPRGVARRWTADTLCWRLSCPTASYVVHEIGEAMLFSTVTTVKRIRVAILLKLLSSERSTTATARRLVGAACQSHRAPVALHVGVNPLLELVSFPLPRRLRPSPLNFIHRSLDGGTTPDLGCFELLDFDAY